jgi:hypothetical protein
MFGYCTLPYAARLPAIYSLVMTLRRIVFGLLLLADGSAAAMNAANSAEKVVLSAVQQGRPADVTALRDRTVRLAFLKEIGRKSQDPIEIIGAKFPDRIDYLNIPGGLDLRACEFPNGLHLHEARLGSLSLIDCKLDEATLTSPHIADAFQILDSNIRIVTILGGEIGDRLDISTGFEPIVHLSQLNLPHLYVSRPYSLQVEASVLTSVDLQSRNATGGQEFVDTIHFFNVSAKYVSLRDAIVNEFIYQRSTADGAMTLSNFDAKNYFDLSSSTIADLSWSRPNLAWPHSVSLDGAQLKAIRIDSPVPAPMPYSQRLHRNVLDFLTAAGYSAPAFTAYQQSLEDRGMTAEANETAFTMHEKWRTTQYDCTNISRAHCLWNSTVRTPLVAFDLVQQYGFGLGRTVTAPLLWSSVFVICGILVFRRQEWMEPRTDKAPTPYSRSWYSLELFLPVVDLGVAKDWRPAPKPKWRSTYARIHQLAGWILIPVAIAALTGGLKK